MARLASLLVPCVVLLAILSGCKASKSITQAQVHLRSVPDYREVRLDSTSAVLEGYRQKEEDEVLYQLEHAALNHYLENWETSTKHFQLAERAIDRNYTKSINRNLQSLLINDLQLAYPGEAYEDIYLTAFNCLNFLHMNDLEGALVEVRRVTNKLEILSDRYRGLAQSLSRRDTAQAQTAVKKVDEELSEVDLLAGDEEETSLELQQNSAFARFLTTVLYAKSGSPEDARIELRQLRTALQDQGNAGFLSGFSTPAEEPSVWDLLFPAIGSAMEAPESASSEAVFSSLPDRSEVKATGGSGAEPSEGEAGTVEVTVPSSEEELTRSDAYNTLFVAFSGKPPRKKEQSYHFDLVVDGDHVQLDFAVPILDVPGTRVARTRAIVAGDTVRVPLVENMQSVAETMFEKRKSIIYTRAVIRSFLKTVAAEGAGAAAEEEAGEAAGWLTEQVGHAMSRRAAQADTRGWQTMPGFAYTTVARVPEGDHEVTFEYLSEDGTVLKTRTHQVSVGGTRDFALVESIFLE